MVRKFFAVLIILVFVPLFVLISLIFNSRSALLNKEQVKESLVKTSFYDKLVPSAVSDLFESGAKINLVTKSELTYVLNKVVPPDSLKSEIEKTIDVAYPYILSETDNLKIEYNLKSYKKTFVDEAKRLLAEKIRKLRTCNKKELKELTLDKLEGFPTCKPSGSSTNALINSQISGDLEDALDGVPDNVTITEKEITFKPKVTAIKIKGNPADLATNIREPLSRLPNALYAGIGVLSVLLLFISLLRWGSVISIARWVGWTLLISSIATFVVSYAFYILSDFAVNSLKVIGETPILAAQLLSELFRKIVFTQALPQTIVISIISICLIIIPRFIKTKEKQEVTP